MKAVILAAGVGSRLSSRTEGAPKCLIEIEGQPLILHQLSALADYGVGSVMCVLGHQADQVREVIGERAETIVNEFYKETNSLYSFWLARKWVDEPFILLNSDLLFDPSILGKLLKQKGSALAYDSTAHSGHEQTKVAIRQGKILDLGKDLPKAAAGGESLGMIKFDKDGAEAMIQTAEELVGNQQQENAWVLEATRNVCRQVPLAAVNVAGKPWIEIDFPQDLDVARREVGPAIHHHGPTKRARQKRIIAAVITVAALAVGGSWIRIGNQEPQVDWDTVPVVGGELVRIDRRDNTQRWWKLATGEVAEAPVSGEAVVEVRLVLPQNGMERPQYVVEITKDGIPIEWAALNADPDSSAILDGAVIGDRDRIRIPIGPSEHQLGVKLIAGHSDQLLVRIRQQDEAEEGN
ncbi:MAG: phosphocholine cytidylyltransferase family protein [Gemmatimonadota bacterium]|nr:phosphocholine cytidylyltransferase family protein [Gemmatimonadota bacterium]MDH5805226.1 phosphocholine cytidylyltransferase family protein [Gemmatimonadota bacterium]